MGVQRGPRGMGWGSEPTTPGQTDWLLQLLGLTENLGPKGLLRAEACLLGSPEPSAIQQLNITVLTDAWACGYRGCSDCPQDARWYPRWNVSARAF